MAPRKGKLDSHDEDTMMVLNYLREYHWDTFPLHRASGD